MMIKKFLKSLISILCLLTVLFFPFSLKAESRISKKKVEKICTYYEKRDFLWLSKEIEGLSEAAFEKSRYPDCFYRALGMILFLNGEFEKALKFFLKINRPVLEDIVNTSSAYIKRSRLKDAEKILLRASIKYGDNENLLYNLAIVYVKLKDYTKARNYLFKVLNSPIDEDLKSKALSLLNYIGY